MCVSEITLCCLTPFCHQIYFLGFIIRDFTNWKLAVPKSQRDELFVLDYTYLLFYIL